MKCTELQSPGLNLWMTEQMFSIARIRARWTMPVLSQNKHNNKQNNSLFTRQRFPNIRQFLLGSAPGKCTRVFIVARSVRIFPKSHARRSYFTSKKFNSICRLSCVKLAPPVSNLLAASVQGARPISHGYAQGTCNDSC